MKVLHVIPSISERSGGPAYAIISMCRALQEKGVDVAIATTDHGMVPSSEFRVSSSESQVSSSEFRVSSSDFQTSSSTATNTQDSESSLATSESLTRNSKLETRNSYENSKLETRNYKGVPTFFFPAQWGDSFKYSRPFAIWLNENVKNYDLVHIHAVFNHACVAAARACRRNNVPYVVRPLGTLDPWSMNQKPWRKRFFWQVAGKRMMTAAAAVHYTARAEQQATEASLGLNHGTVVPLGVDTLVDDPATDSQSLSSEISGVEGHPYVLVLSRLHPKKGLEILLDAFLFLIKKKEFEGWRLVLAGDGASEHVAKLRAKVEAHHANNLVLFPGWLAGEKKAAALRNASLLALPSHHENFGLCVMESLAYGVPVLISPQVNIAPDIRDAGAGWVAAVDKSSIAAALAEALGSEKERLKRGAAGRNLATDFDWPVVAKKLTDLYVSVLESTLTQLHRA